MRTEKEIVAEIKRCEAEKEKQAMGTALWSMYNDRCWALRWVLGSTQELVEGEE